MDNANISKVNTIDSYIINNNGLCYFKNGSFFINNAKYHLNDEINCSKIIFINNSFNLSFSNGKLYRFDDDNFYKLNIESTIDITFNNRIIIVYQSDEYDYDNWRSAKNLYDLIDDKSLIKTNIFGDLFLDNNEIYVNDLLIIKKITQNLDTIWQCSLFDLEIDSNYKIGKFKKFLGIALDNFFILSEDNRIIVLNKIDGSFVKLIYSVDFPNMADTFINPKDHNIYCLSDTFVKINCETLEIETLKKITQDKITPEINTVLYGIKDSSFQDKYISFTSYTSFKSGFAKWIGLFDYNKEKIIWHYELLEESNQLSIPAFESPKLVEDKLYVLDSEKTLYILELNE